MKVLVVATSRKTRGGITSVVKAHETGEQWEKYHCHWVQTHRDGPAWRKIAYFIVATIDYLVRLPFYDAVHFHISQPTTIKRKNNFLGFAKMFGKKVITHFHAYNTEDTIEGDIALEYANFFNSSDKVIVLSGWWKDQLINKLHIPADKITVLYNPCPSAVSSTSPQEKTILYAGTLIERKGYAVLIKAFAKIAKLHPDWKLILAGNGEINIAKSLAEELGISDQVVCTGWISGDKKESIFSTASIFCLPSYAEGFPMAVLDAWAYGLPVITTPVGGIPDVANDGVNMLLFSPGDVETLATKLEALITDDSLRNRISKASLSFAQNEFNINTINSQLDSIYQSLQ